MDFVGVGFREESTVTPMRAPGGFLSALRGEVHGSGPACLSGPIARHETEMIIVIWPISDAHNHLWLSAMHFDLMWKFGRVFGRDHNYSYVNCLFLARLRCSSRSLSPGDAGFARPRMRRPAVAVRPIAFDFVLPKGHRH